MSSVMMNRFNRIIALASFALLASLSLGAWAGSASQTQTINALITGSCVLTANSAGPTWAYDPVVANATVPVLQTLNWVYTCTLGATPTSAQIDQGLNAGGGSTAIAPLREMINGASKLAYNIYSSAANEVTGTAAVAWGTANGPVILPGTGLPQTLTLYVKIPAGQNLPSAAYTDTVTETLNF